MEDQTILRPKVAWDGNLLAQCLREEFVACGFAFTCSGHTFISDEGADLLEKMDLRSATGVKRD